MRIRPRTDRPAIERLDAGGYSEGAKTWLLRQRGKRNLVDVFDLGASCAGRRKDAFRIGLYINPKKIPNGYGGGEWAAEWARGGGLGQQGWRTSDPQ